jgi:putative ABC transport system permease protein
VLLVACANVAALLASRAPVRAREIAMRMAIGAGRLRLVRQLLIESLLIAAAGGLVGLLLGRAIIEVFQRLQVPSDVPLKLAFALDGRVLIVAMVVAGSSAILSSLLPAWQTTRVDLTTTLKSGSTSDRARLWGRHILVAGQVALSLILLTVAVFLYRGFRGEIEHGPGFRTDRILLASFSPDMIRYDAARTDAFYTQLVERTKALPRVRSVALTSSPPMDAISVENTPVAPEGFQFPAGTDRVNVRSARIDDGYFQTLGVRLLRGRAFGPADTVDATRVAVVNEAFARHYWPGQDPTGKRFRLLARDGSWFEIIGVAATTKYRSLSEGPTEFIYYSRRQRPAAVSTLIVDTEGDAAAMAAPVRQVVTSIDPNMPMFDVRTMQDLYNANAIGLSTLLVRIVGGMGSIALVLALTGLYGLMAYSVSRRTREIGIRMAVGAHPGWILRMVLDHGLWLTGIGGIVGVLGSVAILVVLRSLMPFPAMSRFDITPYAIAVPALLVVTMLAAYVPARRAARIDPLKTLRTD